MENSTSVTSLQEIFYPVYRIGDRKPNIIDNIAFFAYVNYVEEDDELVEKNAIRILDDKTLPFDSLAMRRLAIASTDAKLYKLTKAIFFLGDLIKIAEKSTWFIDSKGKIFTYEKRTSAKLKYYKIKKVVPISTGGAIIEVDGIAHRFKSLFYPEPTMLYAGIIHNGISQILYGLYDQKYDDTWRKI